MSIRSRFVLLLLLGLMASTGTLTLHAQPYPEMLKKFFLLPDDDYETLWKKVEEVVGKGLPESALKLVEQIYERARKERNQPQIIKSATYRVALHAQLSEDGEVKLVDELKEEIASAEQPARAVFQSILATLYWNYYQQNRWRILNRTSIEGDAPDDFRTWDAGRYFDTTRAYYLASLEPEGILKKTPIRTYSTILIQQKNSETYRPTLYDLLAHRALDFLENDEASAPRPTEEFEVSDLSALKPVRSFVGTDFPTPDPTAARYLALKLYQDLLRFHLDDRDGEALIDLDLQRLAYARGITYAEGKDEAYAEALTDLARTNRKSPESAQALYFLARYHQEKGDLKTALEISKEAIAAHPDSRGAANSRVLQSEIMQKTLQITAEQTVLPGAPSLAKIGYRNIDRIYLRILKLPDQGNRRAGRYDRSYLDEKELKALLKSTPVEKWSQTLPLPADFKQHEAEIKLPALAQGHYLVLVSPDENFSLSHNAIGYTEIQATRLSLQSQRLENGGLRGQVADAETGELLPNITAKIYTSQYNSRSGSYELKLLETITTDRIGSFRLAGRDSYDNVSIELTSGSDYLFAGQGFYLYRQQNETPQQRTILFTDRSIYRPGQTVYFKGIVLKQDFDKPDFSVAAKQKRTVTFYDVNSQKIKELELTTNEFGSFSGSFVAPSGVLNGMMSIQTKDGNRYFRVEEYKRPKFEVEFEPAKGVFRLGERIKVKGLAKAYAGSVIDDAEVRYRVVREARFPYWRWWWHDFPTSPSKEIAHGTVRTNEKGEYEIEFEAVPDKSIPREQLPLFTYTVHADVTDINGETQSSSSSVSVGYTTLMLSMEAPATIDTREGAKVSIVSTNLNGEPVAAVGTIKVEKLRAPSRIIRARLWSPPDQFTMTEAEFVAAFPHDSYKGDESNPQSWPVERTALDEKFSTGESGRDSVDLKNLPTGSYRITLMADDPSGDSIRVFHQTVVYDKSATTPPFPVASLLIPIKTTGEPGETASFIWGTGYQNATVLFQVFHRGAILREEKMTFNNEQRTFTLPLIEEYRGGVSMQISLVRDYRLYTETIAINVPWSNKELRIEAASFRDKLKPGQEEEWRFTVKGTKAEKVSAEMVATLYDASLDAIHPNDWEGFAWPSFWSQSVMQNHSFAATQGNIWQQDWNKYTSGKNQGYDQLNLFGLSYGYGYRNGYARNRVSVGAAVEEMAMESDGAGAPPPPPSPTSMQSEAKMADSAGTTNAYKEGGGNTATTANNRDNDKPLDLGNVKIRTNMNETAFFMPQVATNEAGEVIFKFTIPEALTRWRMLGFAHTKDMRTGSIEKSTVTQKELMILPNLPRFFREGDEITFPVKISNLSEKTLAGTVRLTILDAATMKPVDDRYGLVNASQSFSTEKGRSASVSWKLRVPDGPGVVVYRVVASSGEFSDGEEGPIPVLPNRMLVTETLPLNIRGNQTRTVEFTKLVSSGGGSPTLKNHRLTLEMTSNPAWYAVQALPYLIEFPYECSEQIFNRYYANAIASHLANSSPRIKAVFDSWKDSPESLMSNLEKNQELKELLLEETPWVMQGQDETERKKRLGVLFDLNRMGSELEDATRKLEKQQLESGGWPWFANMPEDWYITQYIVAGVGHLRALGIETAGNQRMLDMAERAVSYIDERMNRHYNELKRLRDFSPKNRYLGYLEIHYLYARSFFKEIPINDSHQEAFDFWTAQAKKYWLENNLMAQGMISLGLHRYGDKTTPRSIIASLRERSLKSDEMGMYWKYDEGWWWYQAPIETQAMLIETFDEIDGDKKAVDEMKIWLLKQKQVQDWRTTKATAEACYALLLRGGDFLASDKLVEIKLGEKTIDPRTLPDAKVEAGTGYFKTSWSGDQITPDMGRVTLTKKDDGIAWGALYWQYFEQLNKITPHASPLSISKSLFRQKTVDRGIVMEPVGEGGTLKVGDLLKVRIEIRVDRDMEYIHLKDMRGAGLEPTVPLSGYKWQGGLGYYQSTKDASMNFFIGWLPKGVWVFEYPLRVSHQGVFSNGISTIQCMYAPEFASHSAGITVSVE